MQIGMVGLGRMGGNMARRLLKGGHEVVGYAPHAAAVKQIVADGGAGTQSLDDLVAALRAPRVAWVMVPAGAATEQVVLDLAARLSPGDTIIDGGNSFYKDDVRARRPPAGTAHPLRRRRHERRRLGPRARLLPDDRRRDGRGPSASIPIFRTLAPGMGDIPRTPGREKVPGTAEHGLPPLRPLGRRALREDDPQRHRVRADAGLRRGASTSSRTRRRRSCPRSCATTWTSRASPSCGAGAAW